MGKNSSQRERRWEEERRKVGHGRHKRQRPVLRLLPQKTEHVSVKVKSHTRMKECRGRMYLKKLFLSTKLTKYMGLLLIALPLMLFWQKKRKT